MEVEGWLNVHVKRAAQNTVSDKNLSINPIHRPTTALNSI